MTYVLRIYVIIYIIIVVYYAHQSSSTEVLLSCLHCRLGLALKEVANEGVRNLEKMMKF